MGGFLLPKSPDISKIKKITRKIKKSIFAIPADAADIPVKPNKAAIIEMMKKISAHLNIVSSSG